MLPIPIKTGEVAFACMPPPKDESQCPDLGVVRFLKADAATSLASVFTPVDLAFQKASVEIANLRRLLGRGSCLVLAN